MAASGDKQQEQHGGTNIFSLESAGARLAGCAIGSSPRGGVRSALLKSEWSSNRGPGEGKKVKVEVGGAESRKDAIRKYPSGEIKER